MVGWSEGEKTVLETDGSWRARLATRSEKNNCNKI